MGDVAIVDLVTHRVTEDNEKGEPILSATLSGGCRGGDGGNGGRGEEEGGIHCVRAVFASFNICRLLGFALTEYNIT